MMRLLITAADSLAAATLPEGARLALLHWPWGMPDWLALSKAAGPNKRGRLRARCQIVPPLLQHGLIEPAEPCTDIAGSTRFRLTQAGRRAVDAIQSGEAGQ
ncbi:MAG: hypothetical protein KGQ52_13365 [Alphaproteobacteria bacterium]|nr:hypothetical protein [Alphaproteobacteria bacterium]